MMNVKRAFPWYCLALAIIVLDQITKQWAVAELSSGPIEIFPFLDLTLAYNTGAAFSFLSDAGGWQRWFFTLLAAGVGMVLMIWLARLSKGEYLLSTALALVLGGALGNLYDRVTLGHVVDFVDFYWRASHFPAFNVADSAISVGAVLLIWESFFCRKDRKEVGET